MNTSTLTYIAQPGQITLGIDDDPLTNPLPVPLYIEGYAIPNHLGYDGELIIKGFDITSIKLAAPAMFQSARAVVLAEVGKELHWRQCPQALQWADEQV